MRAGLVNAAPAYKVELPLSVVEPEQQILYRVRRAVPQVEPTHHAIDRLPQLVFLHCAPAGLVREIQPLRDDAVEPVARSLEPFQRSRPRCRSTRHGEPRLLAVGLE